MNPIKKLWTSDLRWLIFGLLALAFGAGYWLNSSPADSHVHSAASGDVATEWTCSMHPQIRQPNPGQCPICGMDLIPVNNESVDDSNPRSLKLSPVSQQLANIQTVPVVHRFVDREVRMYGKIAYDETRVRTISAYLPGRIDRLFVNYVGIKVARNDHLVELYSPDLISAQQEFLTVMRSNPNERTRKAAHDKLALLGLTEAQILRLEKSAEPSDRLTIYSPMSGIVIDRHVREGEYIQTGSKIYTIADLSQVWLQLSAYESDLQWIRYGQNVDFETEAFPGKIFEGTIVFIDPMLNPRTRTVQVRVNVQNDDGLLKPDMLARAVVKSTLASGGLVMDKNLAGKWISPMHPEIIKNKPGTCDVCGMKLVRAEELGLVSTTDTSKAPLVIPASAPLITGKRAVVYLADPSETGKFYGREIELGPRAGDFFVVKSGLSAGDQVVVNGAFKLDSDLQIKARPSMMSMSSNAMPESHDHSEMGHSAEKMTAPDAFQKQLGNLADPYFAIHTALSKDAANDAKIAATAFAENLKKIDMTLLGSETVHAKWMALHEQLKRSAGNLAEAADIATARTAFEPLSDALTDAFRIFGVQTDQPVIRFFCPMAFDDKGAFWLQNREGVENPYFGSGMYRCGEQKEILK